MASTISKIDMYSMIFQLLCSPLLWATLLLSLILIALTTKDTKCSSPCLPPGPRRLPIIGNLHQIVLSSAPHRTLRSLAGRHGPIMLLKLGHLNLVVISSREAAGDVMKAQDPKFASRPLTVPTKKLTFGGTTVAFSPYGDYWRQMKGIFISELLTPKRVNSFRALREEEMSNLTDEISASRNQPIDLSKRLRELFNGIVARAAFGRKCRHQRRFIAVAREALGLLTSFSVADMYPALGFVDALSGLSYKTERTRRQTDEILGEIVREREENREAKEMLEEEEDFIEVLLRLKDSGDLEMPITVDNIKALIFDVFIGATDSSAVTVEWAMSELIRQPEAMTKVQDELRRVLKGKTRPEEISEHLEELGFLHSVVKETLRLHPPVPLIPRVCREAAIVEGYTIPSGSIVHINAWSLGRDPRYWIDAESFKPERFDESSVDFKGGNFEFLPFGTGRRMCPAIMYAMSNVELALAVLLSNFDWELPKGMKPEDLDMTEAFGPNTGRRVELRLIATSCSPRQLP